MFDDFEGPELTATWNLHVRGNRMGRDGNWVRFQGLAAFVAHPAKFEFEDFPWSHENGGLEVTYAARVSQTGAKGRFITLLTPSRVPAESLENGVRFQLLPGQVHEVVQLDDGTVRMTLNGQALDLLVPGDIDRNRS